MVEINWSDQAKEDVQNIINHFAPQSNSYVKIQLQRIFDNIDLLKTFPKLGKVVPEINQSNCRELIIGSYRVVYLILNETNLDILTVHPSSWPYKGIK